VSRSGACRCGAVRYRVDGPVRDVIVCHCDACREAADGPWAASAARRGDLVLDDPAALDWVKADVSAYGASRGFCCDCGDYLLWDAPGRPTVSFAAATLLDGADLVVAAHIWVPAEERDVLAGTGVPVTPEGLPNGIEIPWHEALEPG
jgi:hypothetical protein